MSLAALLERVLQGRVGNKSRACTALASLIGARNIPSIRSRLRTPPGNAELTVSQNSRSRATRRSGGLPAMSAEFMARGNTGDPVGLKLRLLERLEHATLIGAQRAATLQHEHAFFVVCRRVRHSPNSQRYVSPRVGY